MTTLVVCIPSKNRHAELRQSMPSVLAMAARAMAQVVVCDQSDQAFIHPGVRVLHQPWLTGLPAARNALLASVMDELVLFLDDDTDVAEDLGLRLLELADSEPHIDAWGPVIERRSSWPRRLHRLLHLGCMRDVRRLTVAACNHKTRELFGCCFAVRRQVAVACGGFDARMVGYALGEDRDFCWRLHRRGSLMRFAAELCATHRAVGGQRPALRQRLHYLRWFTARHGRGNPATVLHLLYTGALWLAGTLVTGRHRRWGR